MSYSYWDEEMEKFIAKMALDITMRESEKIKEQERINQINTFVNNLLKPQQTQIRGLAPAAYQNQPAGGSTTGSLKGFNDTETTSVFELGISKNVTPNAANTLLAPVPKTVQDTKFADHSGLKPELRAKADINPMPQSDTSPIFKLGIEKNVPLETQKNTQVPPLQNKVLDINEQKQRFQPQDVPLVGGISIDVEKENHPVSDNINKVVRKAGRILLPKRVENWFLGEENDERLIEDESKIPTYEELESDFKNGLISTEDFLHWVKMRSDVNNASVDSDYLKERNKNIGKGVVAIGTAPIGGPKKLGKALGTKYLSKIMPKASKPLRQKIGENSVDFMTSSATNGIANKIIDSNYSFKDFMNDNKNSTGIKLLEILARHIFRKYL